jgi:beta-fructofuranosidase
MGKVRWRTGRYENRRFTAEKEGVVDFGAYYAAKTMLDERGNRILWGWIPETRSEAECRAAGWAGVMALPRVLSIGNDGSLRTSPAPAVEILRTSHTQVRAVDRNKEKALAAIRIHDLAGEIQARFAAQQAFRLRLHSEKDALFSEIAYDPQRKDAELRVNQTTAAFAANDTVTLRMFLDGSVLEVFANDRTAITARLYSAPTAPLQLEAPEEGLESLDAWGVKPISKDRLSS